MANSLKEKLFGKKETFDERFDRNKKELNKQVEELNKLKEIKALKDQKAQLMQELGIKEAPSSLLGQIVQATKEVTKPALDVAKAGVDAFNKAYPDNPNSPNLFNPRPYRQRSYKRRRGSRKKFRRYA